MKTASILLYICIICVIQSCNAVKTNAFFELSGEPVANASPEALSAEAAEDSAFFYENEKFLFSRSIMEEKKALGIYRAAGQAEKEAGALYCLARLNFKKGLYHETLKYAYEALLIFERHKDTGRVLDCKNLLGVSYLWSKDYSTAERLFDDYHDGACKIMDTTRICMSLNNKAVFGYAVNGSAEEALRLMDEAITLCRVKNDSSTLFSLYSNTINICFFAEDYASGRRFLDLAEPLATDIYQKGKFNYASAVYSFHTNDYASCIETMNKAISYFSCGEFDNDIMFCLKILKIAYDNVGNPEKAYETLCRYYEIDSRLSKNDIYRELFTTRIDVKEQQEKERRTQTRLLAILMAIAAIFFMAFISVLFYHKYKSRLIMLDMQEAELKSKNEIVELKKLQQFQAERLVGDVVRRLGRILPEITSHSARNEINGICSDLRNSKDDGQWKEIEQFVPEFSNSNIEKLLKDFPNLTINERRLCVLLNKNMTTKDISLITKQSVQSIITARSRLRSKLGLTGSSMSIQEFLSKYN